MDPRRGYREVKPWILARVGERTGPITQLLGTAASSGATFGRRKRSGRTGRLVGTIGARALAVRCSSGRLVKWRNRFVDYPALRDESVWTSPQNIFDLLCRAHL